jgi:hypothetical protein
MRIDFTIEEVEALTDDFWNIDYTVTIDGEEIEANTGDDDFRGIPLPSIGNMDDKDRTAGFGQVQDEDGNLVGYAINHPDLTWEDEVVLKEIAAERIEFYDTVRKADKADRADLRRAKRTELRQEARQDARVEARRALRQQDRQAARQALRQDLRKQKRIADRLAARKAEREKAEAESVVR